MPDCLYLRTELYQVRQAAAIWFLRTQPRIVEIGGHDLQGRVGGILYYFFDASVAGSYLISISTTLPGEHLPFGLVALGMDIRGDGDWDCVMEYIRESKRAVLEFAVSFDEANVQWAQIFRQLVVAEKRKRVVWDFLFDFTENELGDMTNSHRPHGHRRMIVLDDIECPTPT